MGSVRVGSAAAAASLWLGALLGAAQTLSGQLRPLDPMDWDAFDQPVGSASLGIAVFDHQPASLLGREGRLVELGLVQAGFRTGRVVISVSGSAYRLFSPAERFETPSPVVTRLGDGRRGDMGDYRLVTRVRLTRANRPTDVALRFGVRLPTTDDRIGLERDETDFFATGGARHRSGRWTVQADVGFGIYGVADQDGQTDPLLYAAGGLVRILDVETGLMLVGQYDTREHGPPRGNEHLSELRWTTRSRGRTWVQAELVYGLAEFSPEWGLVARLGRVF